MAEYCLRYTPHITVDPFPPQDTIFLNLTSVSHIVKDEQEFVARFIKDCYKEGFYPLAVALAETSLAGWAFTHFLLPENDRSLFRAWIIPPQKTRYWIQFLPVEAIRGNEAWHTFCHELGCHTIGEVLRIPLSEWQERLGRDFVIRLQQLVGEREEILPLYEPPRRFTYNVFLEYPTISFEILDPQILSLLRALTRDIFRAGLGAIQVIIVFYCENGTSLSITIDLIHPTVNADKIYHLFQLHKARLRPSGPVIEISATASCTVPLDWGESSFFDQSSSPSSRQWEELTERLAARLGWSHVCTASLEPEHAPEHVTTWISYLDCRKRRRNGAQHFSPLVGPRPFRLLSKPEEIEVLMGIPSGTPYRFFYRGQSMQVQRSWGPERIETGWWRGAPIFRDYYRVEVTTGQHFWIYRCLHTGKWFLHGFF